ncbi:MAG: hypothetical protein DCC58_19805 [Chloroflexi bacterium]|nr:MAG: hypothetical protein DCC58_19805 [Chloroflexota bacterium]
MDAIHGHRAALEPVARLFTSAGLYAYRTLDEENRWCVACDLDDGHIDVRIGADGYELDVWATSPGMFADEENDRRRGALERLARISIPSIRRGYLDDNQTLEWNHEQHGISLRTSYFVPFSAGERIPEIATSQLAELNASLRRIEQKIGE